MFADEWARRRFTLPHSVSLTMWGNYLCAGAAAGAAGGVLARVAMRVVALIAGNEPVFTVAASLGIVMIFAIVGIVGSVVWMALSRLLHLRARPGATLLAVGLMLLLAGPIFEAASGDLASASTGTILKFMLLFIPVPLTIAWGTVWGAACCRNAQRRHAKRPCHSAVRWPPWHFL